MSIEAVEKLMQDSEEAAAYQQEITQLLAQVTPGPTRLPPRRSSPPTPARPSALARLHRQKRATGGTRTETAALRRPGTRKRKGLSTRAGCVAEFDRGRRCCNGGGAR